MIRDVLSRIGGVGVYGMISIVLFFVVFLGVLVWVVRLKRNYLETMSQLPLEPEPDHDLQTPDNSSLEPRHE